MTAAGPTIRLLIVGQSPGSREKLRTVFASRAGVDIVGEASTAQKTMRLLEDVSPTAILVECDLPSSGSFTLVKEMMSLYRVPIVMVTRQNPAAARELEVKALEAGAVALAVLSSESPAALQISQENLVRTVRAMSEVKVVRRRSRGWEATPNGALPAAKSTARCERSSDLGPSPSELLQEPSRHADLIAVGASTGGPQVLETLLRGLAKHLTVPVVIVQHLSQGFQNNLVTWLSESTGTKIVIGKHGTPLVPGVIYLAPDNNHMQVNGTGHLILNTDPPENGSRPSVSVLFRSVAQHYGPRAIGILLTGMGRDGAKELRIMLDRGALTIAQDEQTSAVHGMPGEAIKLKGARYVLPPERIISVVEHHLPSTEASQREAVSCL